MKTSFHITLNLGNFEFGRFGVDDFDGSLNEVKAFVMDYIKNDTDIVLDRHALKVFKKNPLENGSTKTEG